MLDYNEICGHGNNARKMGVFQNGGTLPTKQDWYAGFHLVFAPIKSYPGENSVSTSSDLLFSSGY